MQQLKVKAKALKNVSRVFDSLYLKVISFSENPQSKKKKNDVAYLLYDNNLSSMENKGWNRTLQPSKTTKQVTWNPNKQH